MVGRVGELIQINWSVPGNCFDQPVLFEVSNTLDKGAYFILFILLRNIQYGLFRFPQDGGTGPTLPEYDFRTFGHMGTHNIEAISRNMARGVKKELNIQGWALPPVIGR